MIAVDQAGLRAIETGFTANNNFNKVNKFRFSEMINILKTSIRDSNDTNYQYYQILAL